MNTKNPFANVNLRSFYDYGENKWWYSAVDFFRNYVF